MTSVFVHNSKQTRSTFDEIISELQASGYTGVLSSNADLDAMSYLEVYTAAMAMYNFIYKNAENPERLDVTLESIRYVGYKYAEGQLQSSRKHQEQNSNEEFELDGFFDGSDDEYFGETTAGKITAEGEILYTKPPKTREELEEGISQVKKQNEFIFSQNQSVVGSKFEELQRELEEKKKQLQNKKK